MLRHVAAIALLTLATAPATAAVTIDASAARATLEALGNPALTEEAALKVADLPGNAALVKKLAGYTPGTTRTTFAKELVAAARGTPGPSGFRFGEVARTRTATLALADRIAADPAAFNSWIEARVGRFSPPGIPIDATGYLVAGGPSTGFAFAEPGFYLDISRFPGDLEGARVIMAHELFHAVQNLVLAASPAPKPAADPPAKPGRALDCFSTRAFQTYLMLEGTATYVGDPALLTGSGTYSVGEKARFERSLRRVESHAALYEMSLAAMTGRDPVSFDDIYAVGFNNEEPLYALGYVMARAIAARDGEAALGRFAAGPGDAFVRRYLEIASEPQSTLPQLGPRAAHWAERKHCPARD